MFFNGIFAAFVAPGLTIERTRTRHTHTENTPRTAEEQKASVDTSKERERAVEKEKKNSRRDLNDEVLGGSKALEDAWFIDAKEALDKTGLNKKITQSPFLRYFYYYCEKINEKLLNRQFLL